MPYTLGPRQTFEALPTSDYKLTLKSWKEIIEQADTDFSRKGDVRVQWDWIVTVPGAEDQDRRDWCNIPATFSDKATFVHIAIALAIVDSIAAIEAGATIDPDQGIGKSCIGTIVKSLKKDQKTWGDKITAYAPLPAAEALAKPKGDMAAKLRERTSVLSAFAGLPDSPTDGLAVTALTNGLKALGAQPITPAALQTLQDTIETANTFGFNDFDDLPLVGLTLKDALVLFEKITARMDA
jgi:hypothetical protein